MNPINRRGQKIACVQEIEYESITGALYAGAYPELDGVYTVKDFVARHKLCVGPPEMGLVGYIELFEMPSPNAYGTPVGWPIICFRPVDERKTDISVFTRKPVLEDA